MFPLPFAQGVSMRCFVGIDLGTARSGYSYAFSSEPASIKHPSQYTSDDGPSSKTDTALLFEVVPEGPPGPQQWRLDSWGSAAVNKYEPYKPPLFVALQLVMHSGKLLDHSSCHPHEPQGNPHCCMDTCASKCHQSKQLGSNRTKVSNQHSSHVAHAAMPTPGTRASYLERRALGIGW